MHQVDEQIKSEWFRRIACNAILMVDQMTAFYRFMWLLEWLCYEGWRGSNLSNVCLCELVRGTICLLYQCVALFARPTPGHWNGCFRKRVFCRVATWNCVSRVCHLSAGLSKCLRTVFFSVLNFHYVFTFFLLIDCSALALKKFKSNGLVVIW
jgi:hypothetical protein